MLQSSRTVTSENVTCSLCGNYIAECYRDDPAQLSTSHAILTPSFGVTVKKHCLRDDVFSRFDGTPTCGKRTHRHVDLYGQSVAYSAL